MLLDSVILNAVVCLSWPSGSALGGHVFPTDLVSYLQANVLNILGHTIWE